MKETKKPKTIIDKEIESEDWCFICKDGGELIICDFGDCKKVYHAECVRKEGFCSEIEEGWACDRHFCLKCRKTPRFYCFCCPNAVCKKCTRSAEFLRVRDDGGFCDECLELVLLGEEDEAYDSDGTMIDFKDRNTQEGLFKEYWEIIKEQEGLNMDDVYAAIDKEKKENKKKNGRKRNSVSGKCGKDHDDDANTDDDYVMLKHDQEETESDKPSCKRKKVPGHDEEETESYYQSQKRKKSQELEFCGWASKPLIEFLKSIGKDTTIPLGISNVDTIIKSYIREKKLVDPEKTRKVRCDERLFKVFKKKALVKGNIYYLLESHFVENLETSKEGYVANDDKNKEEGDNVACEKHRTWSSDEESHDKEVDTIFKLSGFASIVLDNIKLVYLRRSLVEELLKQAENFERKVVGSFIRIKIDVKDCPPKNSNQILPVTGVEKSSIGEILLKFSSTSKGIRVCTLSDSDFTKEECQDLKEKMENGVLKKLTVVELEEKARSLHEDVTKHWIKRELITLQRRIDYANEKGRRQELNDCIERRELLEKPCYQQKLLQNLPKVIPELVELKAGTEAVEID